MAAVFFVVTIPTEEEETRLKNEFIARKLDQRSERLDSKSAQQNAAETAKPTSIAEVNDEDETTSLLTVDMQPTPMITTNLVQNGTSFSTFPKRRKSDTTMLQKRTVDDMLSGENMKTTTAATAAETGTTATSTTTTTAKSQAVLEEMVAAAVAASGVGGGGGGGGGISAPCSLKDLDLEANDAPVNMRKSWDGIRDILSSTKRKASKSKKMMMMNTPLDLNIPTDTCMEIVLREILKRYDVLNATWTKDAEGRMLQVTFTIDFDETYENILEKFYEWGIGDREGSTVSVMNCIASKTFARKDDFDEENINAQKQGAWERFMNSVRSRLNVAEIVRNVRQDASITFDFLVLLVSAAILASFGLVENSTVFLASSMLISPLMGPIIAGIFGTVIKDHSLRTLGVKNELFGIFAATLVGFIFGLIVCTLDDRYSAGEGLTAEMMSRCELHSLLVGVFTAIPSGAAAAIGILGGNIGSLVGVAISASLLPPAVNTGLLWSLACIYKIFENDDTRFNVVVKSHLYSDNQAAELAVLGSISMCLTISNVLFVYIMGIAVLKAKEIAPIISRNNYEFWKHDIKIARDLNKVGIDSDAAIMDEFANLPKEDQKVLGIDYELLRNIHLDEDTYQNTWSPIGNRHLIESSYEPMRENYSTVHRIERLYSTITRQQSVNERKHKFNFARRPPGRTSDIGAYYRPLSGNIPRCSTMPGNSDNLAVPTGPGRNSSNEALNPNLNSSMSDERKRRKFIVTPAVDPLHYLDEVSLADEADA